jgi:hypothetical protein
MTPNVARSAMMLSSNSSYSVRVLIESVINKQVMLCDCTALHLFFAGVGVVEPDQQTTPVPLRVVLVEQHGLGMT